MLQWLRYFCMANLAFSGLFLTVSTVVLANSPPEDLDPLNPVDEPMSQINSVSQLRDVDPTDWAFEALQALIERYGCIAGYPDGTYRGDRPLSRYEFAAGLNACLNTIERLIQDNTISQEDLDTLAKLTKEFESELVALGQRVDKLENQVSLLEDRQFSTTTKLNTELIVSLAQAFSDRVAVAGSAEPTEDADSQTILTNRLWMYFDTSFSGEDRLRVRLQARTTPNFETVTGTNMTRLSYEGDNDNDYQVSRLEYRTSFNKGKGIVFVEAFGGEFNDNMETFNPYLQSSGKGSISRFGRFNPIYRLAGNAGLTLTYKLVDKENTKIAANIGYLVNTANLPEDPNGFGNVGLFGGPFGALAQLDVQPFANFKFGLTYVRSENIDPSGGTGSEFGSNPFLGTIAQTSYLTADSLGFQTSYQFSSSLALSGWVGYTWANATAGPSEDHRAEILNWAVTLGFADLWHKGDIAGLVFGMPPKVIASDVDSRKDEDTAYHLEALYRFQVNNYISITPGVIFVFNPEHNSNNDPAILGVVRTTFSY